MQTHPWFPTVYTLTMRKAIPVTAESSGNGYRTTIAYSVASVRERTYRPRCRLSAKLVPTFAARGCHVTDPYGRILGRGRSRYFFFFNNQLIRDLFNQPEIGRRLTRMWPEDLIR
jgi:hypothetical protein